MIESLLINVKKYNFKLYHGNILLTTWRTCSNPCSVLIGNSPATMYLIISNKSIFIYIRTRVSIENWKKGEILGWNMRKPSANRPRIAFWDILWDVHRSRNKIYDHLHVRLFLESARNCAAKELKINFLLRLKIYSNGLLSHIYYKIVFHNLNI